MSDYEYKDDAERIAHLENMLRGADSRAESYRQLVGEEVRKNEKLRAALAAADRFGQAVTPRFIEATGRCLACDTDIIGGHRPTCWLKPLLKDVRETFEAAGIPL